MEGIESSDTSTIVVLVEEDALAELAPPPSPGYSPTFHRRTAHFLNPRAATTDPSIDAVSPLPLLRDLLPVIVPRLRHPKIRFWGWFLPDNRWHHWVQRLRSTYRKTWRGAGILDAVAISTSTVKADISIFRGLIECWSPETNTFVLPWPSPAEATLTLEDIMLLGGFSSIGEPIRGPPVGDTAEMELVASLTAECGALKARTGWISHRGWIRRFMGSSGSKPSDLEHAAFLAHWLARCVFPGLPIRPNVIPLAVRLSRGARVALAPAVLASIYRDLRLLKEFAFNCRTVHVWAPFQLLQLWAWERFESLQPPKGPRFLTSAGVRALRWDHLGKQQMSLDSVRSVLESPVEFQWRPYSDWGCPSFCCGGNRWLTVGSDGGDEDDEGMRSYAQCLRACKLVGFDCSELYKPHRVAMQFGLDQDIPGPCPAVDDSSSTDGVIFGLDQDIPRPCPAVDGSPSTHGECTERLRLYMPPRFYEPGATERFIAWQRRCLLRREEAARKNAEWRKKQGQERRPLLEKKAEGLLQVPSQGLEEERQEAIEEEMPCRDEAGPLKRMKMTEGEEAEAVDAELLALEIGGGTEERAVETSEEESSFHPLQPPVAAAEPEAGRLPCGVAIVEIESDDEELQRQRDLEFSREIEELKAEIAGLQAMVKLRESSGKMDAMALSQSG